MNKSRIEWLDGGYTWNPVTGCLHNCEYCYAKKQTKRFEGKTQPVIDYFAVYNGNPIYYINNRAYKETKAGDMVVDTYPFGFDPTFHRYRLDEPQKIKKPQNIFVCSMADLFGEWVPDEWIRQVFEACEEAPWHRYLFLTKNPRKYDLLIEWDHPMNDHIYIGATATNTATFDDYSYKLCNLRTESGHLMVNTFLSVEPIQEEIKNDYLDRVRYVGWVIIGAETGNRKGKVIPKREWIENIVSECREHNVPVFLKDSLAKIWGGELIQEYPWGGKE